MIRLHFLNITFKIIAFKKLKKNESINEIKKYNLLS